MSFKENFERQEDENLNYDDVAFHYFFFAILVVLLVPLTYFLVIRPAVRGGAYVIMTPGLKTCQCRQCTERMGKR